MIVKRMALLSSGWSSRVGGRGVRQSATSMILKNVPKDREILMYTIKQ